jgi:hypothetical protein
MDKSVRILSHGCYKIDAVCTLLKRCNEVLRAMTQCVEQGRSPQSIT